ncbi:MAG: hypothetical protein GWO24_23265 [Akkermansiaceae bacterium]|nr:hypothetical protein [Akkermansiaceae bacterium]
MAELVPGPGFGFYITVDTNTPRVTALGPFAGGSYLERLAVAVFLSAQSGNSALELGFGVSGHGAESYENFERSAKVWRPRDVTGARLDFGRIELTAGAAVEFLVDLGVRVDSGSRFVLVYHDQADGTDHYDLWVSLKTLTVVRALPVEP